MGVAVRGCVLHTSDIAGTWLTVVAVVDGTRYRGGRCSYVPGHSGRALLRYATVMGGQKQGLFSGVVFRLLLRFAALGAFASLGPVVHTHSGFASVRGRSDTDGLPRAATAWGLTVRGLALLRPPSLQARGRVDVCHGWCGRGPRHDWLCSTGLRKVESQRVPVGLGAHTGGRRCGAAALWSPCPPLFATGATRGSSCAVAPPY